MGIVDQEARWPEIDKLRLMLKEAKIPFESFVEDMPEDLRKIRTWREHDYGMAGRYNRNQIIYGREPGSAWKWRFDAIWQYGSDGAKEGLIETYGALGHDEFNIPRVMTAEEAFKIIKEDWDKHGQPDK